MERYATIAALVLFAGACALIMFGFIHDPFAGARADLEKRMEAAPNATQSTQSVQWPWAEWEEAITSNKAEWDALVPPPPPPKAAPPPPPKKPDMADMLKDIRVTRRGAGDKVRIITQQNQRGEYYQVGDSLNGCEIANVTKDEVEFTYFWAQGNETLRYTIPRER